MNDLDRLRRVWQTLGRDDPLWAVLSHPDKRGGRWTAEEFLATGRVEIDVQLDVLKPLGWPKAHALALDFGCGAGRLSRALAAHFERVIGIDVSPSMIEAARALNADVPNIAFRENPSARIEGVADASVDFLFSHITLQHIPASLAVGYVEEFFRVLAPGGIAAFQFVDGTDDSWRGRLFSLASNRWLNPLRRVAWRRRDVFEMHALRESDLRERLARHLHLRLLAAIDDGAAGPGWRGRRWLVVNDAPPPQRVQRDGYRLYVDAGDLHAGAPLIAGHVHEAHVAAAANERLAPGQTVLDIGAGIGAFALPAAVRVGERGCVIAVEPIARNRVLLARAAHASGFDHVRIVAAAAADRAGVVELRTHASTSNSATPAASGELLGSASAQSEAVETIALDTLAASLERLDMVKIDVAGMEPLAMRGLQQALTRWRPVVLSEFHPWAIERASRIAPVAYLEWLRERYPAIVVLHRDGRRTRCTDPAAVMTLWRDENAALGYGERLHLDLLLAADA